MIMRSWTATATRAGADTYNTHFLEHVRPRLESVPGFYAGYLLNNDNGDLVAITVLTLWESMDAIAAFAGPDIGHAVIEPDAHSALLDCSPAADHHMIVEAGVRTV